MVDQVELGWQPIETAPRDGTKFLVIDDTGDFDIATWHRDHVCGELQGWSPFSFWHRLPDPPHPNNTGEV